MRTWAYLMTGVLVGVCCVSVGEFRFEDNGVTLTVLENGKPVLGYNYGRVEPPEGVEGRFWRSCYIHPLFDLDGHVITQDFPPDHYHHRGVFWTWPACKVGEREMDLWSIAGAHQLFREWVTKQAGQDTAEVAVQNVWVFDDDPEPKVRESVTFVVHPADEIQRSIDFQLIFTNTGREHVHIGGETTGNKGYGGFLFRPDAALKPFTFTAVEGVQEKDVLKLDTPWADVSWKTATDGAGAGVAVFQHPKNPGYPHPGWIMRHYGFLGASWPHLDGYDLAPGASFELRYRLYVHRGDAEAGKVAEAFRIFAEAKNIAQP